MDSVETNLTPVIDVSEPAAIDRLETTGKSILELEQAAIVARRASRDVARQGMMIRCRLAYATIAQFMRQKVSPFLGWRWAVVLIGTVATGGLFFVVFLSFVAGLLGAAIGAALFGAFVALPSDSRLHEQAESLRDSLAAWERRREEDLAARARIDTDLRAARECRNRLANELERYRQSRLFRLRALAAQNWKAMRGGELEAFLAGVFTELGYATERKGGAGDQGVDLIVEKDGHRIAVQVKGYVDSVPNTAIQEAFTGMAFYKCDGCAVITNSRFTSGGRSIADNVGCALIDEQTLPILIEGRADLWQEVLAARTRDSARPEESQVESTNTKQNG